MDNYIIVYDSRTNNVERFVYKIKENCNNVVLIKIKSGLKIKEPYHLITYTTGMGAIPKSTYDFLKTNDIKPSTISSSGNMNWGQNYGIALEKINYEFNIPKGIKFELSGNSDDVIEYINVIKK